MTYRGVRCRLIQGIPLSRPARRYATCQLIARGTVHIVAIRIAINEGVVKVENPVRGWVRQARCQLVLLQQVPLKVGMCASVVEILDTSPLRGVLVHLTCRDGID